MTRKKKSLIIALIIVIIISSAYFAVQNNWIETSSVKISLNLQYDYNGLRIAHLSDIHLPNNASTIDKLLKKVEKIEPDIIMLTGDIVDKKYNYDSGKLEKLAEGLSHIAPVYCVLGNHEIMGGEQTRFISIMTNNNVTVLDNEFVVHNHNEMYILILGLGDSELYYSANYADIDDNSDLLFIMLAHHPENADNYISTNNSVIPKLILSGHAHGGQFRLPIVGGLVAPNQGLLPYYDAGLYELNNSYMYVSRGLGNSIMPVRFNNRPELVVIEIVD